MKLQLGRESQDEVHIAATQEVSEVKQHCPLIAALGNRDMQDQHWAKIWTLCETPPTNTVAFSLNTLLEQNIDAHLERVEEISAFAAGEAGILRTIAEIAAVWEETSFVVKGYRDTKDRFYITEVDELYTLLEDDQVKV